jgi:hypothetical protein
MYKVVQTQPIRLGNALGKDLSAHGTERTPVVSEISSRSLGHTSSKMQKLHHKTRSIYTAVSLGLKNWDLGSSIWFQMKKKLNYKVIDLDENYNFHKKFTLIWDHTKKLRFFKMKWLISPCGMTIGGANVPHMCIVHNCCVVRWLEYGSTSNHCMIRIRWLDPNAIWYDSWSIVLQEFSKIECLIEKKWK